MNRLTTLFVLTAITLLTSPRGWSRGALEKVEVKVCNPDQKRCLSLAANVADLSLSQTAFFLPEPRVQGLNLERRIFSSAFVDFAHKQILLRERHRGRLMGEWFIHIDTLESQFFPLANPLGLKKTVIPSRLTR